MTKKTKQKGFKEENFWKPFFAKNSV